MTPIVIVIECQTHVARQRRAYGRGHLPRFLHSLSNNANTQNHFRPVGRRFEAIFLRNPQTFLPAGRFSSRESNKTEQVSRGHTNPVHLESDTKLIQNCYTNGGWVCQFRRSNNRRRFGKIVHFCTISPARQAEPASYQQLTTTPHRPVQFWGARPSRSQCPASRRTYKNLVIRPSKNCWRGSGAFVSWRFN